MTGSVPAAQSKPKGQTAPLLTANPAKPLAEQSKEPAKRTADPSFSKPQPEFLQKKMLPESKQAPVKSHRQVKAHKKLAPKATAQPRTDLKYQGMFEDTQRFNPRRNSRAAGVPNPQISDLAHDHFQELDRNHDGRIDPVERALGRLDMERDLDDHQLR